jgi:YD repeat-containing protein
LRTTTYTYGEGNAEPYGSHVGQSLRRRGDWSVSGQRRPQLSVVNALQGQTFNWSVPQTCSGNFCFDTRARPTTIVRSGVNSAARTESTTYYDDTTHWILGQVAQVKCIAPTTALPDGCGSSGTVMSATTYDAAYALPLTVKSFGKLRNTFTYDTTSAISTGQRGTVLTAKDGNDNVTTYSNWMRGIPRSVHFPATTESPGGATRTAVVSDQGWITSVTDENGFETDYEYDDMGRITRVTYPSGPGDTWADTTSAFAPVPSAENGVAAGHWRETVSTGDAQKVTVFDALWRPVLVHETDQSKSGSDRYVATAYDKAGRVIDTSYPLGTSGFALTLGTDSLTDNSQWSLSGDRPKGVRTDYDALGRPISVRQDSEMDAPLDVLTTTTAYMSGFRRRVTDARLQATTEQFMAWDTPTFDLPVQIDAPEGQRTTITRDVFGKPTEIVRGGNP